MKKFLGILFALVLVVGIGLGVYFFMPKSSTVESTAVMTLETNPGIQLVLNKDNKVISATPINEDGEKVLLSVDFVGLTAEEAAEKFAEQASKFVTYKEVVENRHQKFLAAMTGDINVNITIACEDDTDETYLELKESVKNSVNNYFKEARLKCGAIVNVTEDIAGEIEKLGYDVSSYATKTYKEIMQDVEAISHDLKDMAYSLRDDLFSKISTLRTQLNIVHFEDVINMQKGIIADLQEDIEEYKESIKNLPNGALKDSIQASLNTAQASLKNYKKVLKENEDSYKVALSNFEQSLNAFIDNLKQQSEELMNQIQTNLASVLDTGNSLLEEYIQDYGNNSNLLYAIETYQNSLNA